MTLGVVTDSSCDLPAATLLRLGVAAVPLRIQLGGESYRYWRDLAPDTLYRRMDEDGLIPTTTAPEARDFQLVYQRFLATYDQLLSIHTSSRLSNTLEQAAAAAPSLAADRIRLLDSGTTSLALAEIVLAAAETASTGASIEQVLEVAKRVRDDTYLLMSPRSTDWLERRGPLQPSPRSSRRFQELCPILRLREGEVTIEATARQGKATREILGLLHQRFGRTPIRLAIGLTGRNRNEIERLKRRIELTGLTITRGRVQFLGPMIGAHLGPGTTAICAYPDPAPNVALNGGYHSLLSPGGAIRPGFPNRHSR